MSKAKKIETVTLADVKQAREKIKKLIKKTPLVEIKKGIYLKLENRQPVVKGFKIRGAANYMVSLPKSVKEVITSALGTHGFAVGYIGKKLGIKTTCVMIENPPKAAEEKMKSLLDNVLYMGTVFSETEKLAKKYADKKNIKFIHPYNDDKVVAGQGTVGLEILEQLKDIQNIYVPIGGGGLISGISVAVKAINPKIKIIGVQPKEMHAMVESIKKDKITLVDNKKSLAEKLAINLSPTTITFNIIKKNVDYFITPSEESIKKSIKEIYQKTGEIVEGAGTITYAAALEDKKRKGNSVCIVSGGNISEARLEEAICFGWKEENINNLVDWKNLKIKIDSLTPRQKEFAHLIYPGFLKGNKNKFRKGKTKKDYVYTTPIELERGLFYLHPFMDPFVLEQGAIRRFPTGINVRYISEKYFDDKWVSEGNNALKLLMEEHIKINLAYYQEKKEIKLVDIGPCGGAITTLFALGALEKFGLLDKVKIAELDIVPNVLEATILGNFFVPNELLKEYSLGYAGQNGEDYKKILRNGILIGIKEWYKQPKNKKTVLTNEALELSAINQKNNNFKVKYFRGDGEMIPKELKNYDFVLSAYTHHHMNIIGRKKLCEQMEAMAGKCGFIGIADFYVKNYDEYMKWYKPHFIRYGDAPPVECPVIDADILKSFFKKIKMKIYKKPLQRSLLIYGVK